MYFFTIFFTLGAEPVQLNVPPDEYYSKKITNKIVQQIHVIITFELETRQPWAPCCSILRTVDYYDQEGVCGWTGLDPCSLPGLPDLVLLGKRVVGAMSQCFMVMHHDWKNNHPSHPGLNNVMYMLVFIRHPSRDKNPNFCSAKGFAKMHLCPPRRPDFSTSNTHETRAAVEKNKSSSEMTSL